MKHLHRITNLKELEKIDETLSWTVDYQLKHRGRMEITLFKLAGWVAVPVISEKFFTPIVQEQLQQTLLALGYREIHAVALVPKVFVAYKVPVTFVDLMNLRLEIDSSCYALFTGESEPDWVIICIDSELEVIAGPTEFVRQVLGCDIEEAFSQFQNFIMHEPIPERWREHLRLVHDCLKHNYPSAEVGAEFCLTPAIQPSV